MQIYSNREVQKQKDELIKSVDELPEWEQQFVTSVELTAIECLSPKQKSKITELWEKRCN